MANRLVDNFIIVDSSMGNLPIVGGTSANITSFHVNAFAFLAANTTGVCIISGITTTDHVFRAGYVSNETGSTAVVQALQTLTFSVPQRFNDLKVPTLTAGTAWVYLA